MPPGKRLLDIIFAAAGLLILSPILLVVGLLVRVFIGAPVLFWQERPGYKGRPFHIVKFRTMSNAHDGRGVPLPDSQRLARFGNWLRALSLDELPELYNILRGDMSFVGPRPLLMDYLPLYSPEQMRRHDVPPGLTGWAQVNGRNSLSWPERFRLDVWYVDHQSIWLDLRILFMTIGKVLSRQGINQPGEATMNYFTGNED